MWIKEYAAGTTRTHRYRQRQRKTERKRERDMEGRREANGEILSNNVTRLVVPNKQDAKTDTDAGIRINAKLAKQPRVHTNTTPAAARPVSHDVH